MQTEQDMSKRSDGEVGAIWRSLGGQIAVSVLRRNVLVLQQTLVAGD